MKFPFTEKFLWDAYRAAKITATILNKWCEGRVRGLRGAQKMMEFLSFADFSSLIKIEQKKLGKERFGRLIKYLQHNGYLYTKKVRNKKVIMLTPKGAEKILSIKVKIEGKKRRKDGKWQMVIFDIPENIRNRRDCFRDGLKRLKYERLQQSIWICPYDVFKETKELIKYFKLEPFVKLLLTEELSLG